MPITPQALAAAAEVPYTPEARKGLARSSVTNHHDLLPGIDGRTPHARRFRDLITTYAVDMGGLDNISSLRLNLLRRLAAQTVLAERMEGRVINGEEVNVADLCLVSSTILRLCSRLGLDRIPRDVSPNLADAIKRDWSNAGTVAGNGGGADA